MKVHIWKILAVVTVMVIGGVWIYQKNVGPCLGKSSAYSLTSYGNQSYERIFAQPRPSTHNVYIELKVKNFSDTQNALNRIVNNYSGRSVSLQTVNSSRHVRKGTFLFEVDPLYLSSILNELRNLGQVSSEWTSLNQYPYTNYAFGYGVSQLKQQREELLKMFSVQTSPIETQRIEQELQSLSQQIQNLETRVTPTVTYNTLATFTVVYQSEHMPVSEVLKKTTRACVQGIVWVCMIFINLMNLLIQVLTYILPAVVWLAVIALGLFWIWKISKV